MTKSIDFYFDFGSPNAYLAWRVLPDSAKSIGIDINYHPALLGGIFKATNNQPPMISYGGVKGKLDYQRVEMNRFLEKHDIRNFRFNPYFPVNTLLLMRGAVAAMKMDILDIYIDAGMRSMWEQGLNMSDPNVFTAQLKESGLDGSAIFESTQDMKIKAELIQLTSECVARGVFGLPSFFIGDEMFFGKDRIRDMLDFVQFSKT